MPKFENVSCSQCGRDFGPGDHGFSHCENHAQAALLSAHSVPAAEVEPVDCVGCEADALKDELASYQNMLGEACHDLGLIHEALGLDHDEAGGAAPILEAIEQLQAALKLAKETFVMNRIDVPRVMEKIDEALAAPSAPAQAEQHRESLPIWFDAFLTNVCEIPDRNSPEGEPEAIVATLEELKSCAMNAIEAQGDQS